MRVGLLVSSLAVLQAQPFVNAGTVSSGARRIRTTPMPAWQYAPSNFLEGGQISVDGSIDDNIGILQSSFSPAAIAAVNWRARGTNNMYSPNVVPAVNWWETLETPLYEAAPVVNWWETVAATPMYEAPMVNWWETLETPMYEAAPVVNWWETATPMYEAPVVNWWETLETPMYEAPVVNWWETLETPMYEAPVVNWWETVETPVFETIYEPAFYEPIIYEPFVPIDLTPTCSPMMCMMFCDNGFVKDANGCDMCQCVAPVVPVAPTCSPVMCMMFCDTGFMKDANGCDMCQCARPVEPVAVAPVAPVAPAALPSRLCPFGAIPSEDNAVCCPASCGECGGQGCAGMPGGASDCCRTVILGEAQGDMFGEMLCEAKTVAPCVLPGAGYTENVMPDAMPRPGMRGGVPTGGTF